MSAVPGWYPDPAGSRDLRLWDGEAWTSHVRPPEAPEAVVAPQADVAQPVAEPAPLRVFAGVGAASAAGAEPSSYFGSALPAAGPLREQDWSSSGWQPTPAKSHRRLFTGVALGAVIVAAAVAIPTVIASSGSVYERTSIAMPKTAAGFKQVAQVNASVSNDVVKSFSFTGMRMGIYGQGDSPAPAAMLMAGRGKTQASDIDSEMNKALSSFSASANGEEATAVSSFQPIAAGPLGGRMSCATFLVEQVPAAACVFIDKGAAGALFTYDTSTVDPALMHRLRAAVEKRS